MSTTRKRRFANLKKKGNGRNKGIFAEAHTVAPAPSRDYYALQLFQNKFVWTRWKISHGPYTAPLQRVVSLQEFSRDQTMQNELSYIFGEDTTSLITDLAYQKWSLTSMPSDVLQKIFSFMSVPDILRLSQVCKRLSKECSKNELWKEICKKQWKILLHNDVEKAALIGWKQVYLEKMRPKRYKTSGTHHPKPNLLPWHRAPSVSTLNTPESRSSMKSNFTLHKRVSEVKKVDTSRSSSVIFGKDFKVLSSSTGKLTDRTILSAGKSFSRNSESRPTSSGKFSITPRSNADRKHQQQSCRSVMNLMTLAENPKEIEGPRKSKSPRNKCKVTSIRTCSVTPQPAQTREIRNRVLQTKIMRPNTGKLTTKR